MQWPATRRSESRPPGRQMLHDGKTAHFRFHRVFRYVRGDAEAAFSGPFVHLAERLGLHVDGDVRPRPDENPSPGAAVVFVHQMGSLLEDLIPRLEAGRKGLAPGGDVGVRPIGEFSRRRYFVEAQGEDTPHARIVHRLYHRLGLRDGDALVRHHRRGARANRLARKEFYGERRIIGRIGHLTGRHDVQTPVHQPPVRAKAAAQQNAHDVAVGVHQPRHEGHALAVDHPRGARVYPRF